MPSFAIICSIFWPIWGVIVCGFRRFWNKMLNDEYNDHGVPSQPASSIPVAEIVTLIGREDDLEAAGELVQAQATTMPAATSSSSMPTAVAIVVPDQDVASWYDPATGDEVAKKIQQAVKIHDWMTLRDTFRGLRGKHTERSFYIAVIEEELEQQWKNNDDKFSPAMDSWVLAEPDNPDCCLVRGCCYIAYAWNARGSGYADTVGEDNWTKFHARIDQAKADLEHTLEVDPSDALAIANQVTVLMASKGRRDNEVSNLLTRLALSDDPRNDSAHSRLLQFFCRKRGGSDDLMFCFARDATKNLPEGHPTWILIARAHYEAFLSLQSMALQLKHLDRSSYFRAVVAVTQYWKDPPVKQEMIYAYRMYLGSANRQPTTTVAEENALMTARNWFAYCLHQMGELEYARRELLMIGQRPTKQPWGSLDKYQAVYNRVGLKMNPSFVEGECPIQ